LNRNAKPAEMARKEVISVCLTSLCGWANLITKDGGNISLVQSLLSAQIFSLYDLVTLTNGVSVMGMVYPAFGIIYGETFLPMCQFARS